MFLRNFVGATSVLDLYLSQLATRHRKKVGAIEKVEEQCLALNQINSTLVLFALNETLKEQEDIQLGNVLKPKSTVTINVTPLPCFLKFIFPRTL